MTEFSLSKAATRVMYVQLENKGEGFSIKQLRLLDKTLTSLDVFIGEYNQSIQDKINIAKEEIKADPSQENVDAVNTKLNLDLDEITDTIGKQLVHIQIEDEQFKFIKETMENMQGFKGTKIVRDLVLELDTALDSAKEIDQTAKKNEAEQENNDEPVGNPGGDNAN